MTKAERNTLTIALDDLRVAYRCAPTRAQRAMLKVVGQRLASLVR